MVKKIYLSLTLIITCSIYADDTSPKESLKQKVISSSYSFSVNQPAKIYSINASKNKISINSSRIGILKSRSLRMFDAPSRSDKYILKVLDNDSNVIRMVGLGNPFYIHVQHMDFEDRPIFGGEIDRDFDIPIPLDSDAASISFFEQSEFGLKEINKIQLNQIQ